MKHTRKPQRSASLFDDFFTRDLFNLGGELPGLRNASPAVNIKETEKDFQLEVFAAGMKKEDFKIELENNMITVSAEMSNEKEEKNEAGEYTRREFNYSNFSRSFTLPEDKVEEEQISATYTDGVLHVTLPKKEVEVIKEKKKLIDVN